ncbi:MAG: hypothetical protein RBS81_07660 [Tenuifilaceae bacterium]|jgi:hypothetical protein|nr:hypothetical protein [Tenuifilaceae bacterium]
MKKVIAFTLLLSLLSFAGFSQEQSKEEIVKAQKIAFFTQKLKLSSEEAQQFWPVYNDYWARKNAIIEERQAAMKYFSDNSAKLSAVESKKYADMYIKFQKEEADLLVEFHAKFLAILSPDKVMRLYQADYEFKTYLLQQIRRSSKND